MSERERRLIYIYIYSLQDKDNSIEAMKVEPGSSKRRRGPEIKTEGEKKDLLECQELGH